MRRNALFLVNGATLDLVPARLFRARTAAVQRLLASGGWLLRRKSDGRFLACSMRQVGSPRWRWLEREDVRACQGEAEGLLRRAPDSTRDRMSRLRARRARADDAFEQDIGLDYARRTGLARVAEPDLLALGGFDRYRRPLWLASATAHAWTRMRAAALRDGIRLEAISGFRSRAYQVGIFRRKQARGQRLEEILEVNAAPGFSEHHSGQALDIGTPGEPPAEESFEDTPAFAWLAGNASRFGFAMSYPRGNPHGIAYEPWHWMWRPAREFPLPPSHSAP